MFTLLVEVIIARCGYRVKWCACLAYLMQPKMAGFLVADVVDDGGRRRCNLGVSLLAGLVVPPRRISRECEGTTYNANAFKVEKNAHTLTVAAKHVSVVLFFQGRCLPVWERCPLASRFGR